MLLLVAYTSESEAFLRCVFGVAFSIDVWCCGVIGFAFVMTRVVFSNGSAFSTDSYVWCGYRVWSDCVSTYVCYAFCSSPSFSASVIPIGCAIWLGDAFYHDGDAIVIASDLATRKRRKSHSRLLANI